MHTTKPHIINHRRAVAQTLSLLDTGTAPPHKKKDITLVPHRYAKACGGSAPSLPHQIIKKMRLFCEACWPSTNAAPYRVNTAATQLPCGPTLRPRAPPWPAHAPNAMPRRRQRRWAAAPCCRGAEGSPGRKQVRLAVKWEPLGSAPCGTATAQLQSFGRPSSGRSSRCRAAPPRPSAAGRTAAAPSCGSAPQARWRRVPPGLPSSL
mmetsp:Transcript_18094/g.41906  ORF Transcript_18094/g.41906 Transcript_18094/m.41906 type:complete len:207 (-) Transcript_18094:42-662(-)